MWVSLALVSSLHAAILTVDNNPGAVDQYNNFTSAYEAAADGDTILLAGSSSFYGTHELYKRLIIIDPGYFLNENQIPGFSKRQASINLYVRHNPTLGSYATSKFVGLEGVLRSEVGTDGLVVDKCRTEAVVLSTTDVHGADVWEIVEIEVPAPATSQLFFQKKAE